MKFSGFPHGTRSTPVPNPLFGTLLEEIDDPAELKCTLRSIWLIQRKRVHPRAVTVGELLSDRVLLLGLRGLDVPPPDAIRRGIKRAVERGTFLCLYLSRAGKQEELCFLNDEAGRRALAMLNRDGVGMEAPGLREEVLSGTPGTKENIFTLYEENIGMLTPLLAEELKDAEGVYPQPWIDEAFKIAVSRNKRSWSYIEAILGRWATEGKDDGEPGRYSEKVAAQKDFRDYLRRRGRLQQT